MKDETLAEYEEDDRDFIESMFSKLQYDGHFESTDEIDWWLTERRKADFFRESM